MGGEGKKNGSNRLVLFTGAGISRESGLDTFRDPGGIWSRYRVEDVATAEAFARDPQRVQAFYNWRRMILQRPEVKPNPAHHALARLEAAWPDEYLLVTQNVDNLHERAGSRNILHMHGESLKARCLDCGAVSPWTGDITPQSICPGCGCGLRPHVVWFGETPFYLDRITEALENCDLFIAVGTSGRVYPAAQFVEIAARRAHTLEVNLEPSQTNGHFAESRFGSAGRTVPALADELIAGLAERD